MQIKENLVYTSDLSGSDGIDVIINLIEQTNQLDHTLEGGG